MFVSGNHTLCMFEQRYFLRASQSFVVPPPLLPPVAKPYNIPLCTAVPPPGGIRDQIGLKSAAVQALGCMRHETRPSFSRISIQTCTRPCTCTCTCPWTCPSSRPIWKQKSRSKCFFGGFTPNNYKDKTVYSMAFHKKYRAFKKYKRKWKMNTIYGFCIWDHKADMW